MFSGGNRSEFIRLKPPKFPVKLGVDPLEKVYLKKSLQPKQLFEDSESETEAKKTNKTFFYNTAVHQISF